LPRTQLALTALNTSKSAFASISLEKSRFFSFYDFVPRNASSDERFTCSILNKVRMSCPRSNEETLTVQALLSVFTSRLRDSRGRDTSIERCEVVVDDNPGQIECRFVIRMICTQGKRSAVLRHVHWISAYPENLRSDQDLQAQLRIH
jgi:cell cycle checkpoint control protein RAD9A